MVAVLYIPIPTNNAHCKCKSNETHNKYYAFALVFPLPTGECWFSLHHLLVNHALKYGQSGDASPTIVTFSDHKKIIWYDLYCTKLFFMTAKHAIYGIFL